MKNNITSGIQCHDEETIIAQCTPKGSGAIALLRISGTNAVSITSQIAQLSSGKKLSEQKSHTIHFGWIISPEGKKIDQVLFLLMRAPKTFTGQDIVEITTHNNPFIVNSIIETAIQAGTRLAQQGEFSKRAFLNGKIDLPQAEAINELIHAQTQMSLKSSLSQLHGSLSQTINHFENELTKALAYSEASFEFIEDEETDFTPQIITITEKIIEKIKTLKKTFKRQEHIRQGVRIALLGSVNAGKSSLFNALLDCERAIVTNIPGTTRDTIEAGLFCRETHKTFVDTAGLRQTENVIEKEGIEKSLQEAQKADIIVLVVDGSCTQEKQEKNIYRDIIERYSQKIIFVQNKNDLGTVGKKWLPTKKIISISCKDKKNIDLLKKEIDKKIKNLFSDIQSPFLLNERQHNLLLSLEKKLTALLPMLMKNVQHELVSLHLRDAITHLSEFSGKTIDKKAVDKIFSSFCVGK